MNTVLYEYPDGKNDTMRASLSEYGNMVLVEHSRGGNFRILVSIPVNDFKRIFHCIEEDEDGSMRAWILRQEEAQDARHDAVSANWGHD